MSVAVPERSMASGRRADVSARRRYGLEWATMICGAALAVLTAADGSPARQAARVLVVATLTAGAVIGEVRSSPRWRGRVAVIVGVPAIVVAVGFAPDLVKGGPLLVRSATLLLAAAAVVSPRREGDGTRGRGPRVGSPRTGRWFSRPHCSCSSRPGGRVDNDPMT